MFRQDVKKDYYDRFSDPFFGGDTAKCQICGGPMRRDAVGKDCPVTAHKISRGKGGPDSETNVAIAHWDCHEFFGMTAARIYLLERDPCNAQNGLVLKMPADMRENLWAYRSTGVNRFTWD